MDLEKDLEQEQYHLSEDSEKLEKTRKLINEDVSEFLE